LQFIPSDHSRRRSLALCCALLLVCLLVLLATGLVIYMTTGQQAYVHTSVILIFYGVITLHHTHTHTTYRNSSFLRSKTIFVVRGTGTHSDRVLGCQIVLTFKLNNWLEVLAAVSIKMAVFWVVAACRLVTLMMEAVQTSEALVNLYQSTLRYNPGDSHLKKLTSLCGAPKTNISCTVVVIFNIFVIYEFGWSLWRSRSWWRLSKLT
jgi:hypothetical protein